MNGKTVETLALVDSGVAGIFIDRLFVEKEKLITNSLSKQIKVYNVDRTENWDSSISEKVIGHLLVKGRTTKTQFLVTALGTQRVILGYPWLVNANPKINWKKQEFSWWETAPKVNIYKVIIKIQEKVETDLYETDDNLVVAFLWGPEKDSEITDNWIQECLDPQEDTLHIQNATPVTEKWIQDKISKSQFLASKKAKEQKAMASEDLVPEEYKDFIPTVFSERPIGQLPKSTKYDHTIDMKPDFVPKIQKPFSLNPKEEATVDAFINENLKKGFIVQSKSEQASALFFVPKTDESLWPVQDYCYLNQNTIPNAYPLPHIDDLIVDLHEFDFFHKFDVQWGYNNVKIKGDQWKAAFICKWGLFEPQVMYFRLRNSPATFQSMLNEIFKEEITQKWLKVYMDNLLVCGKKANRAELAERRQHILQRLLEHDIFVKLDKSFFFVETVPFLGFIIQNGWIEMDQAKLDRIVKWPPPTTLKQLRSFLGFCNFYRRFITNYADKTAPLNVLLCKTQPWEWTTTHHLAFENMKMAFASKPVLLMPNYAKLFEIKSDASLYATGAVLMQQDSSKEWHPVAFHSQSMSPTEHNYQVYDCEPMAIIHALRDWRCYI